MSLIEEIDAGDKKGLFASNDTFVNYSTGLLPLDHANGFWLNINDSYGPRQIPIIGIMGGTFVSIIGTTGSGKSTLTDQMGYSIIKDFPDGMLFHIDCEQTNLKERMVQITGAQHADPRLRLRKDMVHIEDVMEMFNTICMIKEEGGNRYKYEVTDKTYGRDTFLAYYPTVFVIDSLPSFNSKDNHAEEDLGTNMDAARAAKDVTRFFTNCLGRMMKYNITIFTVNHIVPNVIASVYDRPPRGIMMMGKNEKVNRGYAAQYYSQNYFRVELNKSNLYDERTVGFPGGKASIQIAKTKTAFIGSTIDAAFNGPIGFDPVYTLLEFANSVGLIEGRNPYLYLHGVKDMKFSKKDFRDKFTGEPIFRKTFFSIITPYLEALLGSKTMTTRDRVEYGSYEKAIEEQMLADDISEFNPNEVKSDIKKVA